MSQAKQLFRVDLSQWEAAHGAGDKAAPRGKGRWVFELRVSSGVLFGFPVVRGHTLPVFVGTYRAAREEAKAQARRFRTDVAVLIP